MKTISGHQDFEPKFFDEKTLTQNPFSLFELWYEQAEKKGEYEPFSCNLGTFWEGKIDQRIVYIRNWDKDKFYFYTNYQSKKAIAIEKNPQVSLLFYWPKLEKQIRMQGIAQKATAEISDTYFATRPRKSQLGAWASPQSQVIDSAFSLVEKIAFFEKKFENQNIPRPPYWGAYEVQIESIEFWIGQPSRLHDRFLYQKNEKGYFFLERLAP